MPPDLPDVVAVPDSTDHDGRGLELARAIARSMAAAGRGGAGTGRSAGRSGRRRRVDAEVSGAHPDDRDPQPVEATIARLVHEQGWSTDVAVQQVFGRWDGIVGVEVARHCTPQRFADRVLAVRADSTAWATQLRLLVPAILRRLNAELGDGSVVRIQVLGPHVPSWSKGVRSLRDARGPRDTYG